MVSNMVGYDMNNLFLIQIHCKKIIKKMAIFKKKTHILNLTWQLDKVFNLFSYPTPTGTAVHHPNKIYATQKQF